MICFRSVIGQPGGGGAAGAGDGRLGDGRRSELSLLRSVGSADRGTSVDAATPGFMSPPPTLLFLSPRDIARRVGVLNVIFLFRCEAEQRLGGGSVWPLPLYDLPAEGGGTSGHGHPACSLRRQEALRPATDTRVPVAPELGWVGVRDTPTERRERQKM